MYSRLTLAVAGVLSCALATTSAFGFARFVDIRYDFVTTNLVPMLSLLFGTHSVFMLYDTMLSFRTQHDLIKRMKATWAVAGPSLLTKFVVSFSVFLIASSYPVVVTRHLCYMLALCEIINFLNLFVFLSPCLVWDIMRTNSRRMDLCVPPFVSGAGTLGDIPDEAEEVTTEKGRYIGRCVRDYAGVIEHPLAKFTVAATFTAFVILSSINGFLDYLPGMSLADVGATKHS